MSAIQASVVARGLHLVAELFVLPGSKSLRFTCSARKRWHSEPDAPRPHPTARHMGSSLLYSSARFDLRLDKKLSR